jgi:V-type H+-transporting ATPase subunit H
MSWRRLPSSQAPPFFWTHLQLSDTTLFSREVSKNNFMMSLEPPTYLSSLQNNIRARPIPWEGAVRAGNITDDHLKKIKAVDKVRKDQRRQTIEQDLAGYTSLLAGGAQGKSVLDSASRRTDIVQYILVLASDLIQGKRQV